MAMSAAGLVLTANISGSSKPRYAESGTFHGEAKIDWYRQEKGLRKNAALQCSEYRCGNRGEYGGHVHFKDPRFTGQWFITPLCPGHNNVRQDFYVTQQTAMDAVPLNPHVTQQTAMDAVPLNPHVTQQTAMDAVPLNPHVTQQTAMDAVPLNPHVTQQTAMDAVPLNPQSPKKVDTPSDLVSLQAPLDKLLAGQLAMADRLDGIEARLDSFSDLAQTVETLKTAYCECMEKIGELEKKISALPDAHAGDSPKVPDWETVRRITREEVQADAHKNNVVLSGVHEEDAENLMETVKSFLPDIDVLAVRRLGKLRSTTTVERTAGGQDTGTQDARGVHTNPRRILLELNPTGRQAIWGRCRQLTYAGKPIFVNHDLTPREQAARREAVPALKKLRAKNVRCTLPRSQIIGDNGQPLTAEIIDQLLA